MNYQKYYVGLCRILDGKIKILIGHTYINDPELETMKFMWTEGNYSCDCNRHLFWEREEGREPEENDLLCGDDKQYKLIYGPSLIPPEKKH